MPKLTSEKKALLKQEVLEELTKNMPKKSPVKKPAPVVAKVKKSPTPIQTIETAKLVPVIKIAKAQIAIPKDKPKVKSKKIELKTVNLPDNLPTVNLVDVLAEKKAQAEILVKKAAVKAKKVVRNKTALKISGVAGPEKIIVKTLGVKTKNQKKNFWLIKVFFILVAAIVVASVTCLFGLYQLSWRDGFSRQVSKIFNLPAGRVTVPYENNTIKKNYSISLNEYLGDLNVLKNSLKNNRDGLDPTITADNLKNKVFERLVMDRLARGELSYRNQSIKEEELMSEMNRIISEMGGQKKAEQSIQSLYQLSLKDFKNSILLPIMIKDRLQKVISGDEKLIINQNARQKAMQILQQATQPTADFKSLAKQFTEDEAGVNTGGDLGWISRGEVPPVLENILFSLNIGTVYTELIKSDIGYHILRVDEKLTDPDTKKESVKASHILIKINVDKYLEDLLATAKVKKYIN